MTYTFKQVANNRGYFIRFDLEVMLSDTSEEQNLIIEIESEYWVDEIEFAARTFFFYFKRKSENSLSVSVKNVNWYPGDTSAIVVLFGVIESLSKATNFVIPKLKFDKKNGLFCFPR